MSGSPSSGSFERKARALLDGLRREFPPSEARVRFGGQEKPLSEVVAAIQEMVAVFEEVRQTRIDYRLAVNARRRAMKAHRSLYEDAVVFLKHHFGKASSQLCGFGLTLPKPRRQLPVDARARARRKAAETRRLHAELREKQRQQLVESLDPPAAEEPQPEPE